MLLGLRRARGSAATMISCSIQRGKGLRGLAATRGEARARKERRGRTEAVGSLLGRPQRLQSPARDSRSLAAQLIGGGEGKCCGDPGLYSRANGNIKHGFNGEKSPAKSTGFPG